MDSDPSNPVTLKGLTEELSLNRESVSSRLVKKLNKFVRTRVVLGVAILLVVDFIWVAGAVISEKLFKEDSYPKPLFSVYFKTSLFTICLFPFIFWKPWHRLCRCRPPKNSANRHHTQEDSGFPTQPILPPCRRKSCLKNSDTSSSKSVIYDQDDLEDDEEECTEQTASIAESQRYRLGEQSDDEIASLSPSSGTTSGWANGDGIANDTSRDVFCSGTGISSSHSSLQTPRPGMNKLSSLARGKLVSVNISGASTIASGDCDTASRETRQPDYMPGDQHSVLLPEHLLLATGTDPDEKLLGLAARRDSLDSTKCGTKTKGKEGENVTITKPSFENLTSILGQPNEQGQSRAFEEEEQEEEEDSCNVAVLQHYRSRPRRRSSKVHFSQVIEVRHRKSWNDIKTSHTVRKPGCSGGGPQDSPLSVAATALLALVFGIIWFFGNYFYQLAFLVTTVGVVNTLSSLSGVFVLILSAIPVFSVARNDRITLTKVVVVIISGGGAVLVGVSQVTGSDITGGSVYLGLAICYSTAGAFLYATYLTLLKKIIRDTDRLEIPMFFGFVGLFDLILLSPIVVIWHYSKLEEFEWPPNSEVWTLLIVNGFVGTVLSEILWLIGSFLTSPLVGTLSLSMVAPLSIAYDMIFEKTTFSYLFFGGAALVMVAFVCVALLEQNGQWDPAWRLAKAVYALLTRNSSTSNGRQSGTRPLREQTLPEESTNLLSSSMNDADLTDGRN